MSPSPAVAESVDRELLHLLRFGGLDKENLNDLVSIVSGFQRQGLRHIKVFPIGIPAPDGLEVKAMIEANSVLTLLKTILFETPRATGIAVFPYGIPNPDVFQVNVQLGGALQR